MSIKPEISVNNIIDLTKYILTPFTLRLAAKANRFFYEVKYSLNFLLQKELCFNSLL